MDVSVVIPAYNAAATLGETLESLLSQTFRRWEAIVVDDGSTDETRCVADTFSECDARIRVVSQPHAGVSAARNTGISLAPFDWILFLDADDLLLATHLERLTCACHGNPEFDAVYCDWAHLITKVSGSRRSICFRREIYLIPLRATASFPFTAASSVACRLSQSAAGTRRCALVKTGIFGNELLVLVLGLGSCQMCWRSIG
jgi:glycosyltransferase involved in cell wall biosynthesis